MGTPRKYTDAQLTEAVEKSQSMLEVCRNLGLSGRSGNAYSHIARRIARAGLNTTHFLGRRANQGSLHRGGPRKKIPEEVLILYGDPLKVPVTRRLRRALLESGVAHLCAECGAPPVWRGKPLVLEIDHISGRREDCRGENLRFLCPNCHSQTETFGNTRDRPTGVGVSITS